MTRSTEPRSIAELLALAAQQLPGDSARLDAEILLAHALAQPRSYLFTWPERRPDADHQLQFMALLARRRQGEPVAHLTGQREFWSLMLQVTPDTLIPRPETETLVELALQLIPADATWQIADLGTGSGAIALALASERAACRIVATDSSSAALGVAQANAAQLGLHNITFIAGDWCAPLNERGFEMIVSNPPYIRAQDPHLDAGDLRFEPRSALVAGSDGLDALRRIATQARACLRPGGILLLEHGWDQGPQARRLLQEQGYMEIATHPDTAGRDRVVSGRQYAKT
jgi:release factor glutamine methyltransferase